MSDAPRCHCGAPLTITRVPQRDADLVRELFVANCLRCRARAARGFEDDGYVVVVSGYGNTEGDAARDYHDRGDTF